MSSGNLFLQSFSLVQRQWRISSIVYFFQWCLAMTLGMQVYDVLNASIGHSLEIKQLLSHYDHTVLMDFLKVHGASITPLIGQLRWLLLAWLLFSVFMDAGLLYCISKKSALALDFWLGGASYFFSFLKISLLFLGMMLIWTGLIWGPVLIYLEPSLAYFPSEQYSVWLVILFLVLYILGLAELLIWSVLSRYILMDKGGKIFHCLVSGRRIMGKSKGRFLGVLLAFGGAQIVLIALYWGLDAGIGMTSSAGILILFIIQQAFVFFRIQLRQMMYAGLYYLAAPSMEE